MKHCRKQLPSSRRWPPWSEQTRRCSPAPLTLSLAERCATTHVQRSMQAGTVTTKGSLARNLHRLRTVIVFMEKIMMNLHADVATTLSTAVSGAYADTLAAYHGMVVRTTCNAGFLLLPSRAGFLQSLGETGALPPPCCVFHDDMPSTPARPA